MCPCLIDWFVMWAHVITLQINEYGATIKIIYFLIRDFDCES